MNTVPTIKHLLLTLCLLASSAAWADWELDNTRSMINFVSIKNNTVGEVNTLKLLEGSISVDGKSQLTIYLASVETLIEIRNERMRELLFETVEFPHASVTAQVDPKVIAASTGGQVKHVDLPITLRMHGREKDMTVYLSVVVENDGALLVFTTHPVLINAADFGLEDGVEALRKVAGLSAISNVVPVSMQLRFVRTK